MGRFGFFHDTALRADMDDGDEPAACGCDELHAADGRRRYVPGGCELV